jgi:hypothetical protein
MPDPRLEALAGVVARVEGATCWLARLATRAAVGGACAGLVLWWVLAGDRIDEWWRGTAASLLVLALVLAPALGLVNARLALVDLVELPDKLGGVATRRAAQLRREGAVQKPDGGLWSAVRAIRDLLRDYGDVAGSWGTVAQLALPSFWLLTVGALTAVPAIAVVAAVAALVDVVA